MTQLIGAEIISTENYKGYTIRLINDGSNYTYIVQEDETGQSRAYHCSHETASDYIHQNNESALTELLSTIKSDIDSRVN
ncbi:hypothetical protein NMD63_05590 [Edwardsiella tarda]|uniref:hypothetical protein n=1 Tax=Edwardsiella tarda TaxID=636 RepID=UPI00351C3732